MTLRKLMPAFLLLVALVASAGVTPSLRRDAEAERVRATGTQDADALRARNEGAIAGILGEMRATASDLMFMKTNRYLHAGIAYSRAKMKPTSGDKQARFAGCGPGIPTLIRSAQDDFRGFLGNLERQVKPYRPADAEHHHTTMAELIPWFRVMTLTNPHYIRGYRVGAAALLDENKWQDAYDFLQEGLANNPDHPKRFLLFQSLCSFHVRGQYFQDKYPFGDAWPERALAEAREACRLGLLQRPEHGETGKIVRDLQWDDDLEEDFAYAANMIPLLLSHLGRNEAALRQARELTRYMPHYEPLLRLIHRLESGSGAAHPHEETTTHKHEHGHDAAGADPADHPMLRHMAEAEKLRVNTDKDCDLIVHAESDGGVHVVFTPHFLEHRPPDILVRLQLTSPENTMSRKRFERLLEDLHGLIADHDHGHEHEHQHQHEH